MYGWAATEVIGHPLQAYIQSEYIDTTPAEATRAVLEQGIWKGKVIQKHRNGTSIPVLASVSLTTTATPLFVPCLFDPSISMEKYSLNINQPFSTHDLAEGIQSVLSNRESISTHLVERSTNLRGKLGKYFDELKAKALTH